MFPYNCGTILHSFEKNESSLKHNLNSSTRPISVRKLRKLPGVFKQVWKYITSWMSLSCAAQQLTKENVTHWAKGKIANNIWQCSCFHLLSLPKEKYVYIVYEVVCLCYIPSRQCFEEMRFFKEVQFSSKHPLQPKSCCYLQAGGCFWASLFFQEEIFLWRLDCLRTICVIYDVYCVLKCNIPVFPLSW